MAHFLAGRTDQKILLIEAGPDIRLRKQQAADRFTIFTSPELNYGYNMVPQSHLKDREIPYERGKCLGGCSATNFLFWTTGSRDDYDLWAEIVGDEAWKWESVEQAYKEV